MNKDTTFSIRIASSDLDIIKKKARQARLSQSDYVTRCCLRRQVVVIEDLKDVAKQLRAIGSNLNQLTALVNMGRVSVTNLDGMTQELASVSATLRAVQEREVLVCTHVDRDHIHSHFLINSVSFGNGK